MKRLVLATALWVLLPQAAALAAEAGNGEEEDSTRRTSSSTTSGSRSTSGRSTCRSTKAVAYLMLGAVVTMLIGILLMRVRLHRARTGGRRSAS